MIIDVEDLKNLKKALIKQAEGLFEKSSEEEAVQKILTINLAIKELDVIIEEVSS